MRIGLFQSGVAAAVTLIATAGCTFKVNRELPWPIGAECVETADCEAELGPAPCGTYECVDFNCNVICEGCADADLDGYGMGTACAGPDCDDDDRDLIDVGTRRCYTGPPGTAGNGICQSGEVVCNSGVWDTSCVGDVTPQAEVCNDVDDDCDGVVDGAAADTWCTGDNPPAPCGKWVCRSVGCRVSCPNCTDPDEDGYGTGTGCAGLDCADDDFFTTQDASAACYTGSPSTQNVGACRDGRARCVAGEWSPCIGEVQPVAEACNGVDDDCDFQIDEGIADLDCGFGACGFQLAACDPTGNGSGINPRINSCGTVSPPITMVDTCGGSDDDCDGAIDEDCASNCLWVLQGADAMSADGSRATPYATIQAAIDAARASAGDIVCVQVPNCSGAAVYSEAITMKEGVHVYGGYDGTQMPMNGDIRCTFPNFPAKIQLLVDDVANDVSYGVLFDDSIRATTILDGFELIRANARESSGVTVDDARGAVINNVMIWPNYGGNVEVSTGIKVIDGAEATISKSVIRGGSGSIESIGIDAVDSRVIVRDSCAQFDSNGRCETGCNAMGSPTLGIVGRSQFGGVRAHGVRLERSPDSLIDRNAICNTNSDEGAAIFIAGDADGVTIRRNHIHAYSDGAATYGIWAEGCEDRSPWIGDNELVRATAGSGSLTVAKGIHSIGNCHPVIDSNLSIVGGSEGTVNETYGIECRDDPASGFVSKCFITNNSLIRGSALGVPPLTVGVRCATGGCARIEGNQISGGNGGQAVGMLLEGAAPFVDANWIIGGCGVNPAPPIPTASTTGVYAAQSWSRLQNNVIQAGHCGVAAGATEYAGLHIRSDLAPFHMDVHSNILYGRDDSGQCVSTALVLESAGTVVPARGVFRNNIVLPGENCMGRFVVVEEGGFTETVRFQNNDLAPDALGMAPTSMYEDDQQGDLTTVLEVNNLGPQYENNISVDPAFQNFPSSAELSSASLCIDAGTTLSAPATDMSGDLRDAQPDIGPQECLGCP